MNGFLLALLLVAALAMGGRDQWLVAQWSRSLGRSTALLVAAMVCASASAAVMAWIGAGFAAWLPPRAEQMLVAFGLAMAAGELALPVRVREPREPTRSLAALGIVLLSRQIGDGARFAIVALAAWTTLPFTAGLGGAIGGIAALACGWAVGPETLARWPLRPLRLALALALGVAALFVGLDARFGAY